jgi:ABC-2 type transport system permease protein
MSLARKYGAAFRVKLQDSLEFRVNLLLGNASHFLPLVAVLILWSAVFKERTEIQGYTFSQVLTYFVAARAAQSILWINMTQDIEKDIKDGLLSKYLLMPISYFGYWLSVTLAEKSLNAGVVALFFIGLGLAFKGSFFWQGDPALLGLTFISLVFALFINFCMAFTVCLSAFWMQEIWAVGFTKDMLHEALSGGTFMLEMLPPALFSVAVYLPFASCLHFPLMLYLGRLSAAGIWQGFALQTFWAAMMFGLSVLVWRAGIKRYEAVGA